jgi:hypothetical protein
MSETQNLDELRDRAASYLREWRNAWAHNEPRAGAILRDVAECYVDARAQFTASDSDLTPDWKGRSGPYREWVKSVFSLANVEPEVRKSIQPNIAYYVSSILRDRLSTDELRDAGLDERSFRERRNDRREGEIEMRRLFDPDTPVDELDLALLTSLVGRVVLRLTETQRREFLSVLLVLLTERHPKPRSLNGSVFLSGRWEDHADALSPSALWRAVRGGVDDDYAWTSADSAAARALAEQMFPSE